MWTAARYWLDSRYHGTGKRGTPAGTILMLPCPRSVKSAATSKVILPGRNDFGNHGANELRYRRVILVWIQARVNLHWAGFEMVQAVDTRPVRSTVRSIVAAPQGRYSSHCLGFSHSVQSREAPKSTSFVLMLTSIASPCPESFPENFRRPNCGPCKKKVRPRRPCGGSDILNSVRLNDRLQFDGHVIG